MSEVLPRQGMALALRNITSETGLGNAEDDRCCNSGKRNSFDEEKNLTKRKFSCALEKVAKEFGVEHISTSMFNRVLPLSY